MFERFTEEARNTLFIARASASSRYAPRIEPEDMLHGILIAAPSAVARFAGHAVKADALTSDPMAIGQMTGTVAATAHEAQDAIRRHDSFGIPFSGMTRDTLTYAAQEADALGHRAIGAEHLVLGLLRAEGSQAWRTLHDAGVVLPEMRRALSEESDRGVAPRVATEPPVSEATPLEGEESLGRIVRRLGWVRPVIAGGIALLCGAAVWRGMPRVWQRVRKPRSR